MWEPNDSYWKQYNYANYHLQASGGSRNNEWSYYQEKRENLINNFYNFPQQKFAKWLVDQANFAS